MKNKVQSIKNIFIKKILYSSIAQIIILIILAFFIRKYISNNQLNYISNDLLIKDTYTIDSIGRDYILGNKYALDLGLHNIGEEKKLDSLIFTENILYEFKSNNCNILNNPSFKICKLPNNEYLGISAIKVNNKILGYVQAKKKYDIDYDFPVIYDLLVILLMVLFYFIFNFIFIFLSMKNTIEKNTNHLLEYISSKLKNTHDFEKINIDEYKKIAQSFLDNNDEIIKLQEEHKYYETIKEITMKVAHDLRSPTAMLSNILTDSPEISENKRILISKAVRSVTNISNNILKDYINSNNNEEINQELIFVIINNIVSSKEKEHENKKITFKLNITKDSYSCFSEINLINFERVISNLINNSVESIHHDNGLVTISISCSDEKISILIEDNGIGIQENIIHKVTEQGFSYGKKSGTGLGLYYAKEQLEILKGQLIINSEFQVGTKITIKLNRAEEPSWFCKNLDINKNSTVLVLDDDISVHEMWKEKIGGDSSIKILDFYDAESLDQNLINKINADLYLIDYQLLMNKLNGLEIIKKFNLNKKSYLVTSNFEDIVIREKCSEIGVKIIPKPYVPHINIVINKDLELQSNQNNIENLNLIISILDDEEEVLNNWRSVLGEKNVFYFLTPDDFILEFINNSQVSKTNLLITDYYFNNNPVTKIIDFIMLKDVLEFNGKIFLFSNVKNYNSSSFSFDYIFPFKDKYFNRKEINDLYNSVK